MISSTLFCVIYQFGRGTMFILGFIIWFLLGCSTSVQQESVNEEANHVKLSKLKEISSLTNMDDIRVFCAQNKEPEVQQVCRRYMQRSHLFEYQHQETKEKKTAKLSICSPSDITCWETHSHNAKTVEEASSYCSQLESSRWEKECYFTTAENWLRNNSNMYDKSVSLCRKTGNVYPKCLQHLTILMLRQEFTLQQAVEKAAVIENHWSQNDKVKATQLDLFWFTFLDMYRNKFQGISAALYDELPLESHPHITSYLVHTLITRDATIKTPAEWKDIGLFYIKSKEKLQFVNRNSPKTPSDTNFRTCNNCIPFFNHGYRSTSTDLEEDVLLAAHAVMQLSNVNK